MQLRDETASRIASERRLFWVVVFLLCWGAAIVARLVSLQVFRHDDFVRQARQQHERTVEIPAPRGTIYDRHIQPLAMSVQLRSVFINPMRVQDPIFASEVLSNFLKLDRNQLFGRMKWYAERKRGFMWVKRKVSRTEYESLAGLKLSWIEFQSESQRYYPSSPVGAHVIGTVGSEEQGTSGIELGMNSVLEGYAGEAHVTTDVRHVGFARTTAAPPEPGTPLVLAIDQHIQFVAEREIAAAVQGANAKTGSVVVMIPNTGEILAMASYPPFDPSKPPPAGEDKTIRFNNAASVPFEPGSVFKVFTISAALETTSLRPDTIIHCGNGSITIAGRTIHESHRGQGSIPMYTVLAKSSNIGAIVIGNKVGPERFYEYMRRFGLGETTGLEVPAESPGRVRKLKSWGATSLSSMAMGHEVSVSTVQLARACSVIANGGKLYKARLVLKRGDRTLPIEAPRQVLKPETAIAMRQMMEGVISLKEGTGHKARLDGWRAGGKTGSAQIYDFAAKRYTHMYNASFMGFAPVVNPQVVVVVTVNGTRGEGGFGGHVSAPVFKSVTEEALRVLDVPKDTFEEEKATPRKDEQAVGVNDLPIAISEPKLPNILEEEERPLVSQPAAAPVPDRLIASAGMPGVNQGGASRVPRVPNFIGMTMRSVVEQASARGLQVMVDGSGVARTQDPAPGDPLHPGERIRIRFGR